MDPHSQYMCRTYYHRLACEQLRSIQYHGALRNGSATEHVALHKLNHNSATTSQSHPLLATYPISQFRPRGGFVVLRLAG